MKRALLFLLILKVFQFNMHGQDSSKKNPSIDIESIYKSAKAEFDTYEKQHGGFVQTPNVKLHYLEWGNPENTSFIWIHGSFTNAYEFSDFAPQLVKKGYHIIAIDYYGHGQTSIPKHEVSLYHVADDLNTLMTEKGIEQAIIGGWSRGGILATAFYDAYPEKVMGLVLEDGGSVSTNTHYHKMSEVDLNNRINELFKDKFSYPVLNSEFEAYKTFYSYEEAGNQFKLLAWITENPIGKWSIGTGTERLFHMSNKEEFRNTILRPTKATLFGESMSIIEPKIIYRNLNVPMLIIDPISDQDLFPYEVENKALTNQHPTLITHKIYKETGHNAHYEKPEQFSSDVSEFLNKVKEYWSESTKQKK